jgi:hypothetical protein
MSAPLSAMASAPTADIALLAWLSQAEPGDIVEYHRGYLALDRTFRFASLKEDERIALDRMASLALRLSDHGLIDLVQRRIGGEQFAYLAVARSRQFSLSQFLEVEGRA